QAEAGIRDRSVTGVQTCALPIVLARAAVADDALVAPVLAGVGDARLQRLGGGGDVRLRTAHPHRPALELVGPVHQPCQLGAAAADRKSVAEGESAARAGHRTEEA